MTRNAKGSGNIRKRPEGRWEARYTVGRDPGTGKQVRRSVYGDTQEEVRKLLTKATAAIDEGVYTDPEKITLGGWLDVWLEEYTADLKPHTLKSYTTQVKVHIQPALGAVQLVALTAPQIQRFYNRLQKDLSPKTIKNIHGVLHKALQQAEEIGYLRHNPSGACKLPRAEKAKIKPLEDTQIAAFLEAIQGHMYETVYFVDLFTGMRQGEVLGLMWNCVDFQRGTILIDKQLQKVKGIYSFASLKNNKSRTITPAPFIMRALQEHKRKQAGWQLLAGPAWQNADGLVFTNELGGHLTHFNVYRHFKAIAAQIGIPAARFHDLRHSYAVAALQSGDDIKTVQENLGHHTAAFTLDVYGHVSERMKQESAARMEAFYNGVKGKT